MLKKKRKADTCKTSKETEHTIKQEHPATERKKGQFQMTTSEMTLFKEGEWRKK